jgi:hypothetical protein
VRRREKTRREQAVAPPSSPPPPDSIPPLQGFLSQPTLPYPPSGVIQQSPWCLRQCRAGRTRGTPRRRGDRVFGPPLGPHPSVLFFQTHMTEPTTIRLLDEESEMRRYAMMRSGKPSAHEGESQRHVPAHGSSPFRHKHPSAEGLMNYGSFIEYLKFLILRG